MNIEDKLKELREVAELATPGPWRYFPGDDFDDWQLVSRFGIDDVYIKQDDSGVPIPHNDGKYMEVWNPQTALALLDYIEELKQINQDMVYESLEEYD